MAPVFDAVASAGTINGLAGNLVITDTQDATAGATVLAFVMVETAKTVLSVTYGSEQMNPVPGGSVPVDNFGGNIYLFELTNAPGGPQTVTATLSANADALLCTVSYTGVSSAGIQSTTVGAGSPASQSLTCSANQVIVQAIGATGAILSAPTGGTNRAAVAFGASPNNVHLVVSDATAPTTFGASLSWSPYAPWGAIGVVLA